jgi:hypothetical protein
VEHPEEQAHFLFSYFAELAKCDFSFSSLLDESELTQELNPKSELTAPVLHLCFSAWNTLRDIAELVESCTDDHKWATAQKRLIGLLVNLVVYLGRIMARFRLGDWIFESEAATCRFQEEAQQVLMRASVIVGVDLLIELLAKESLPYQ